MRKFEQPKRRNPTRIKWGKSFLENQGSRRSLPTVKAIIAALMNRIETTPNAEND
jgi:hypothetical protein